MSLTLTWTLGNKQKEGDGKIGTPKVDGNIEIDDKEYIY